MYPACIWKGQTGTLRRAVLWGVNQELWLLNCPFSKSSSRRQNASGYWCGPQSLQDSIQYLQYSLLFWWFFSNCLPDWHFHVFCTTEYSAHTGVHHIYAEECNGCGLGVWGRPVHHLAPVPLGAPGSLFMPQCWLKTSSASLSWLELCKLLVKSHFYAVTDCLRIKVRFIVYYICKLFPNSWNMEVETKSFTQNTVEAYSVFSELFETNTGNVSILNKWHV